MDCEPAVSDTYLKLTTFFSDRQRAGSRLLADAMLDLYAERGVANSVMLRGIASFGPRHIIRSDESLTLSEDLPVAIAAVDTEATIGGLIDDVVGSTTRGLITLERARLYTGELPEDDDAVKLTVYVGRRRRINGAAAFYAVCDLLHRHHFAGATVFLGVDGTALGRRRRARFFSDNADVPIMIIAIGSAAQAQRALPDLEALMDEPLMTVERVQVCKRDGELLARPPTLPAVDALGRELHQKLTIYTDESTHHDGLPIHRALVRRLWESETVGGATVLRGIWGFHGDHKPHGDKLIQYGRQVPVTTIVVDTPEIIAGCFDLVDELTGRHGLVTSEMVPAMLMRDGDVRSGATDLADYLY
jgi:PII-like signaling protein